MKDTRYAQIYDIVASIPQGSVATYGQIAEIAGNCTARMVGFAMAGVTDESGIPWHRVVNSRGRISIRRGGMPCREQMDRLKTEGIRFDAAGRIDLDRFGWSGI